MSELGGASIVKARTICAMVSVEWGDAIAM